MSLCHYLWSRWGIITCTTCALIVLIRLMVQTGAMAIHSYDVAMMVWLSHYSISQEYAHGFCFAVLCCGYTLTDFSISIRLTSLALWQSNDCPSASKVTLMNMDKYFMWIHYERLHNHNKAKHNKTVCIFLGIYCTCIQNHMIQSRIHTLASTVVRYTVIEVWV